MTSNEDRAARLAAIAERAASATQGPWRWRGTASSHHIMLQAQISMRPVVMDFVRWGTQSARPVFVTDGLIVRPPWVLPEFWNPWKIEGIDHPDARFIEHSRSDIDFLLGEVGTLRAALTTLVADDLNAWGASIYEDYWQCHWCHAEGADICDEPRVRDHKAECPWLLARALVGHAVPSEEEGE